MVRARKQGGVSPRRTRKARKARRARRLKAVTLVILMLLLIADLLPMAFGDISPERPSSNYGVDKELLAVQDKRTSDKWENIITSEAQGALDEIDIQLEDRPPVSIEESVTLMDPDPPAEPEIFQIIEETTLPNRTTIIEFLIARPSSYMVFTRSGLTDKWSEGLIRPSLGFNTNGTLIDWEKWVEVDVDNDTLTGDSNGYDARVKLDIQLDTITIVPPQVLPYRPAQAKIEGGVSVQVEKVSGANALTVLPLEVYVVKSYSYQGNNFLWTAGFNWPDMPNSYKVYLKAREITAQRAKFDPDILNLSLLDTSQVVNISGPYDIYVNMDTRPLEMDIMIGYAKVQFQVLSEMTWATIFMDPADGLDRIPERFHLNLESPSFNKSFDKLVWDSSVPVNLNAVFKQTADTITAVALVVDDMPTYLMVELNDITGPHGEVATNVAYEASTRIKFIDYTEFEFYGETADQFTHSRIIINDLPKAMHVNGTFEIGGEDVPPPENLAIGFVARFMDNMMRKITGKFYRVAKTLRTIPNNIIHMPEKKGYVDMVVLNGETIGSLEFYVSSKSRVEAVGNYIAFRNDTAEVGTQPTGSQIIPSSLSGRLSDIGHVYMDFTNGTILDMTLGTPTQLRILFIDDTNDARAVLELDKVPAMFHLRFHPDNINIRTGEPLESMTYTSLVGNRYFRLALEDLPTDLVINQKGGRMKLSCAEGQSLGAFMLVVTDRERLTVPNSNYNHIYLDRSLTSYYTSIRLKDIRSLDMQMAQGGLVNADFSKERDLYMDLSDAVQDVETKVLFSPFPSNFSIELPMGFTTSGIRLPNVLNVTSLFAFSPMILEMDRLAGDILKMTTELTENIATQLGSIGTNTTMKLRSKVPTTLIADMRKGPAEDIRWVYGINVAIDNNKKAVRGKIYMRLPLEATINMRTEGDLMDVQVDFKGYDPIWEFLDIRVTGMSDRDVAIFLDQVPKEPTDLNLDAYLDTNMVPGKGRIQADVKVTASKDIGPLYVNMRKTGGMKSVTTIYASALPRSLTISTNVSDMVRLKWDASTSVKNLYVLIQKEVREKWYDVTLTLNKVPTKLYITAGPSTDGPPDMDGSLLQALPEISVSGSTASLSVYIYMEGPAMGQPQTYEIHMSGITDETYTVLDEENGVYKIRSQGLGFLYLRIIDMPYMDKMQIVEAEIFADEVYSADIKVDQALGAFPILKVTNYDADTFQFRAKTTMNILGQEKEGNLMFADISFDGPVPRSAQLTKNGVQLSDADRHVVVPAPIATLMATILGG